MSTLSLITHMCLSLFSFPCLCVFHYLSYRLTLCLSADLFFFLALISLSLSLSLLISHSILALTHSLYFSLSIYSTSLSLSHLNTYSLYLAFAFSFCLYFSCLPLSLSIHHIFNSLPVPFCFRHFLSSTEHTIST